MPNGAVASELEKDGKKNTILRDFGNAHSLLKRKIELLPGVVVTRMSLVCHVLACCFSDFPRRENFLGADYPLQRRSIQQGKPIEVQCGL
jgi:hypothetical protein